MLKVYVDNQNNQLRKTPNVKHVQHLLFAHYLRKYYFLHYYKTSML